MRARKEALRGGVRPRQVSSLQTSCACNDADGYIEKFNLSHAQSKQLWHAGPRLRDELCGGLE